MSSVDLFNEMVILRDKIDKQMQMDIWPKLFRLLPPENYNVTLDLSFDELTDFLMAVANASVNQAYQANASMVSNHLADDDDRTRIAQQQQQARTQPSRRNMLNLFGRQTFAKEDGGTGDGFNEATISMYRKACQRLVQYYTLSSTSTADFKVGDLVMGMIYLAKMSTYRPLFALLETTFEHNNECIPHLEPDQMYNMVNLLRGLLELPASTVDADNVKLLRSTMSRVMSFPLTRFPRVIIMPNAGLTRDERCTVTNLFIERAYKLAKMESQQFVESSESNRIPYCDDEEFINELLKMTENFSLPRMFYNATNSIFYTTMENYAINNCKFNINDYNNIYKALDTITEECSAANDAMGFGSKNNNTLTDSLNIYLNGNSATTTSSLNKRRKYL
ncbi:P40, BV/ODV-EC42 [Perigonia lusca single nucleopolyhedrovirus]|uniref:p40, BV/ODV-EC42 n=1 Tax=Perigonia lusca single nucleopolyhedrovirus TaxID=1675865 RepID=A0A0M3WNZ8_9ABAC|nr:P40, BV/ODV-EC42 [Perigonia lusca single nucleopolyhedrovirus]AKN80662.1 P40, BV/ODV-EC42 [Perigonia lusca single nucleopolyhedrovirus]